MRLRGIIAAISIVGLFSISATAATIVGHWEFNEPVGTQLDGTLNSGAFTPTWDAQIDNSFTNGSGAYRLRRSGGTDPSGNPVTSTSLANIGTIEDSISTYRTVISSFEFVGHGGATAGFEGREMVRFELLDDSFPSTTARMVLERIRDPNTGTSQVFLFGEALSINPGEATNIPPIAIFQGTLSVEPLSLELNVDLDTDSYEIMWRFGSDPFSTIGSGVIAADRILRYGRLTSFYKLDSTPEEHVDIDMIQIETSSTLVSTPEPGVPKFILFALAALPHLRQRGTNRQR